MHLLKLQMLLILYDKGGYIKTMTREEAIEVFNELTKHIQLLKGEIVYSQFFIEAMEMAITAFEREEYQATHPLSIRIEQ